MKNSTSPLVFISKTRNAALDTHIHNPPRQIQQEHSTKYFISTLSNWQGYEKQGKIKKLSKIRVDKGDM
jgi:hypothetical protein